MTLEEFLPGRRAALAFSGGTDSAYLLAAALAAGCRVQPYFAQGPFQPRFEREDARRLCGQLGVELRVLPVDPLADSRVRANGPDRCYHCKRHVFEAIRAAAAADGFDELWDGTNASDDAADRPGMRALAELGVQSPLRLCNLTKAQVRQASRRLGLFTAEKPAYACLATRVPAGTPIETGTLWRVEQAEAALAALGFTDLRVRVLGPFARLQLPAAQLERAAACRGQITRELRPYFDGVLLDLAPRGEE